MIALNIVTYFCRFKMVRLTILDSASALFRDLHSMTAMEYKLYSLQASILGYAKVMTINYLGLDL